MNEKYNKTTVDEKHKEALRPYEKEQKQIERKRKKDTRKLTRLYESGYEPNSGNEKADKRYSDIMARAAANAKREKEIKTATQQIDREYGARKSIKESQVNKARESLERTKKNSKAKKKSARRTLLKNIILGENGRLG